MIAHIILDSHKRTAPKLTQKGGIRPGILNLFGISAFNDQLWKLRQQHINNVRNFGGNTSTNVDVALCRVGKAQMQRDRRHIMNMNEVAQHTTIVVQRKGGAVENCIFKFAQHREPVFPSVGIEHTKNLIFDAIVGAKLGNEFFIQMFFNAMRVMGLQTESSWVNK